MVDDAIADALQLVQVGVPRCFDDEFEAGGSAEAIDGRGAEGRHKGPLHVAVAAIAAML